MRVRSRFALLATLSIPTFLPSATAQLSPASLNQINTLELHIEGKPVGKDVYAITRSKQGYKLASRLARRTNFVQT